MKRPPKFIQKFCVRVAERVGWLCDIKSDVVSSYLSETREPLERASFTSHQLSFAAFAAFASAATLLIALLPQPGLEELLASREADAVALYENILRVQTRFEGRPDVLPARAETALVGARSELLSLLSNLDEIRTRQGSSKAESKSVLVSVRLRAIQKALQNDSSTTPANPETSLSLTAAYERAKTSIATANSNLTAAESAVADLPSAGYTYANQIGRQTLLHEDLLSRSPDFPQLKRIEVARLPEHLQDWNGFLSAEGKPYNPAEVLRGERMGVVAGGIAMVTSSVPKPPNNLSSFILSYDMGRKRLILLGPETESYSSDPIDPQILRALNAFVAKGQTIAVSIGWSGADDVERDDDEGRTVLLDPTFVDTRIGQDLVRADSIPWEFTRTNLDGWLNPMAREFKSAYDEFRVRHFLELSTYLSKHEPDPAMLRRLAEMVETTPDPLSLISPLRSVCSIEPAQLHLAVLAFEKLEPSLTKLQLLDLIDRVILRSTTLATAYDDSPSFRLDSGRLIVQSELQYRYRTSKVEYGAQVRFGKCLGEDAATIESLDRLVNAHVKDIEQAFPPVRMTKKYGAIAAFLRWARQPGNIQGIDFYSLLKASPHDMNRTPTPDRVLFARPSKN